MTRLPPLFPVLLAVLLAGCITPVAPHGGESLAATDHGGTSFPGTDDAVVIAVVDYGFNPYHLEWRAYRMPQHLDESPGNDFPLALAPHAWLPGVPGPEAFASYGPLDITLPDDPATRTADLLDQDAAAWEALPASTAEAVHLRHVPGTKIIGLVNFREEPLARDSTFHGARAASAAAGSIFGTCPECLLVFVQRGDDEAAFKWALRQPWIDVVTNSWALSVAGRTFVWTACDLDLQREAAERGQTFFFGASNGLVGGLTPGTNLQNCHMGPDWTVTVGGVSPRGASQSWSGKPADVAAPSMDYPTQGGETIGGEGIMGGTSVATPVTAGTYAHALAALRARLEGPSRVQEGGVVARGFLPGGCGPARPACEAGDGEVTAPELRTRLFEGARHTLPGTNVAWRDGVTLPPDAELEYLSEGHGTYWGRMKGAASWTEEHARIVAPATGDAPAPARPAGEAEWFVVDSYCRQAIWGEWARGAYAPNEPPPEADARWPLRTAYLTSCLSLGPGGMPS